MCSALLLSENNAKILNTGAFCKIIAGNLPTILRSENFALNVAKPFVSGHFSKGREWSEIGRKIFEKYFILLGRHLKNVHL